MLLSLVANAASMTASISAWNKASLSGDVASGMSVEFVSTSKSGGQILADHDAELLISGLPACTVQSITVYVHSNQRSGAGVVIMSLATQSWLVADGDFHQWPGMSDYSTTSLPLTGMPYAITVDDDASLKVYIAATTNSIYLEKITVDYTPSPPQPHTLTLQWPSQDGTVHTLQLTETIAGEGVVLPSIAASDSLIDCGEAKWTWIGWCKQDIGTQNESPHYWQTNDGFYMTANCTLYALFTNASTQILSCDSSYTRGEYALCYVVPGWTDTLGLALAGNWQSGRIALQSVPLEQSAQGKWVWPVSYIDEALRYELYFNQDSVSIYHPSSQKWIGYSATAGSNKPTPWACLPTHNGTVLLYGAKMQKPTAIDYNELSVNYDLSSSTYYASYRCNTYVSDQSRWYLFPTASVPTTSHALFSTLYDQFASPLPELPCPYSNSKKIMDPQGRIIIQTNNNYYHLNGQPL